MSVIRVRIEAQLVYDEPIGAAVGLDWHDCQVITFQRVLEMSALPPIGITMFMDRPDGSSYSDDPVALTVRDIAWFDHEDPAWFIRTDHVGMGKPDDPVGDIEWMKSQEFTWQEEATT